ncbi:hypothetical protein [Caudoviricetes sp.]|nr:hypothetical protein [Caudoviricetes sp.]
MSDLENRIVKLEITSGNHAEDIKELRATSVDMKRALDAIEKTLVQIKYVALGALAMIILQTAGVEKLLPIIFK